MPRNKPDDTNLTHIDIDELMIQTLATLAIYGFWAALADLLMTEICLLFFIKSIKHCVCS